MVASIFINRMRSTTDEDREKNITELMEKTNMNREKVEKLYDMGIKSFDGLIGRTLMSSEELTDDRLLEKNNESIHIAQESREEKYEEAHFECPLCGTTVGEHDEECSKCKAHFAQGEVEDVQYVCPSCGSPVNDEAIKCCKCGKEFEE
jgi:predicted RNA-binding Zn-ribbon protein involved in translation (DUF1610 family)